MATTPTTSVSELTRRVITVARRVTLLVMDNFDVKTCGVCNETKPLDDFHRQPSGKFGRHSYCAKCACAKQRESRVRNYTSEQKRKWQLQTRYGLSLKDFDGMLKAQNDCCKLCDEHLSGEKHVDHCHNTGVVRGILCRRCNVRLGGWDDLPWREKAIAYLGMDIAA